MKKDWINKNIEKMVAQIISDFRYNKPLPLSITMHGIAFEKFIEILKSKSSYFPNEFGMFNFLTIPVKRNNNLPLGTFTVERMKNVKMLAKS